jgi:biopolymer transport protein TolR
MPSTMTRGRGRRTISEINMVPFIDVMLVLLIIFMVTAPLIAPSVINLPSVAKADKQPDQVVQIIIGKDEALDLKIDNKTVRLAPDAIVTSVLQAQNGRPPGSSAVVISADKDVRYENVVNLMDKLQTAGVQRVGLSVKTTNTK